MGNQITFGTLDGSGEEWKVMITFNVGLGDGSDGEDEGEGEDEGGKDEHGGKRESRRGGWIVNRKECMQGERDVTDIQEIEILAQEMGKTWVEDKVWQTGKGVKHEFYVEYAPMDIWGDGIAMNPGWLYESLDLGKCSGCDASASASLSAHDSRETQLKDSSPTQLSRCGKCGTATYCSSACQKKDWPVHKHICSLGLEERGQMLAITQKGGLIAWDKERMYAREGSGEMSKNPFLEEGTVKRWRSEEWFVNDEEEEMKKMETRD